MGMTAEIVAERYGVSREQQDAFAARSQERAVAAIEAGHFEREIVPVTPPRTEVPFLRDEHPRADTTVESLAAAPARIQARRRHRHGGQLGRDQRRRRGARADAGLGGRSAGASLPGSFCAPSRSAGSSPR